MAMECIKNCCQTLVKTRGKDDEATPPGIAVKLGVPEDYLLSKLPPDGKEVPFVLPTLKASYVQPGVSSHLRHGMPGPVRCTYAQRKAELLDAATPLAYSSESNLLVGHRPGGDARRRRTRSPDDPRCLSTSMFELSSPDCRHLQGFESVSSVASTPSSIMDSYQGSAECVPHLGRLCLRLSYQQEVEQVWITLVQCSEVKLPEDSAPRPKIRIHGTISIPKAVHFKSSIKEYWQHVSFMETFVFALSLQALRCSALVLRLRTHGPRKRTLAEGVLPLRQLGHEETEHWLHLGAPCKSSVAACELHVVTCFQPACRRVQVQVLSAQNLPPCSAPLPPAYVATLELHQVNDQVTKKKTRALKASGGQCQWAETFHFPVAALDPTCWLSIKLYSYNSVKRKQCLGQVQLGLQSASPNAVDQWKDAMAHPEKMVSAWHHVT
ncbi:tandem C2 domains nuclear protein [Dunckerocampus dactyliophorus]|uniref:tandem C2 domains nuclear protein n=1 Tax=Dunckerocampus dactyliophorus TaxID=161453 RepID=UPI002404C143|nr:tandem C2 domains nuclear protein [Dunckerocampus dactyliophorus]